MAARPKQRIDTQAAFVLHQYPYKETSRLLDVFSRDHGRVMMVARGAQRPGSQLRSILLGFQPVLLSWFGAGELKTLHSADWQGGIPQLHGLPLLCGFYLNELLLRLLPRDEPQPMLFASYFEAVRALSVLPADGLGVEPVLREFERILLDEIGYGVDWLHCTGQPIEAGRRYSFDPTEGIIPVRENYPQYDGEVLLAFAKGDYMSAAVQGKLLMRQAFSALLGEGSLCTRQLLIDLQKL
ncbi:DNA repair protein RecO [Iodobacter ciconiae]|uniref:DNA repair protein RecO n=1 Tax=Iodobacter ciconiae TaxID=2496266 RepID=A0A3S8ZSC0_9NEIS|nr:DNA repair protein RecO [Iodobacter ciconiae]AZN36413.1 DNA repair protein RecO [Iodobacter ciconiae]